MKKRIILDRNRNLPKAGMGDWFELQQNRKNLVERPILRQSRRDKTVLIGRYAVNKLLGRGYHRDTYDFDVKSKKPRVHAGELERSIDMGTNSNLAFVEKTSYPISGRVEPLYRVRLHVNDGVEADYGLLKRNMRFVVRGGTRFETLGGARKKYRGMINRGEVHRMPKAYWDLSDIETHSLIKKNRYRLR